MVPEPPEASFETPLTRLLRMRAGGLQPALQHLLLLPCSWVPGFSLREAPA